VQAAEDGQRETMHNTVRYIITLTHYSAMEELELPDINTKFVKKVEKCKMFLDILKTASLSNVISALTHWLAKSNVCKVCNVSSRDAKYS